MSETKKQANGVTLMNFTTDQEGGNTAETARVVARIGPANLPKDQMLVLGSIALLAISEDGPQGALYQRWLETMKDAGIRVASAYLKEQGAELIDHTFVDSNGANVQPEAGHA